MTDRVIIVGGGLAGLCCARHLQQQGIPVLLLEAADGVGGRIRTDVVDGFRLDRGFQVFLTSYPEARAMLDYDALQLAPFIPGALVRKNGQFHQVTDPWRAPMSALASVRSPVGSLADKLRLGGLRARTLRGSIDDQFTETESTTLASLQADGFSEAMIDTFFRPFLGGIFLESDLTTSSRFFHFVFRMFASGDATLPAAGMEAIPKQLAAALPADSIRLGARVTRVTPHLVTLDTGEELPAAAVVVATDGPAAARLLGEPIEATGQGVTCLYFAAPQAPIDQPVLVLNGEGQGVINNLCVPTAVAPTYSASGEALISVSVLGAQHDPARLEAETRQQLEAWFGAAAKQWRHLRTYRIPYALPSQTAGTLHLPTRPVRWQSGIFVCGDHRDHASIQGAMVSGRRAAEAVLAEVREVAR